MATGVAFLVTPHPGGSDVRGGRVAVLLAPDLSWDCLGRTSTDAMVSLVGHAAVGSLSMQTAGGDTSPVAVAATLGAGARTADASPGRGTLELARSAPDAGGLPDYQIDPARWASLVARADGARYGAALGALGSSTRVALIDTSAEKSSDRLDAAAAMVASRRDGSLAATFVGVAGDPAATASQLSLALASTSDVPVVLVALPPIEPGGTCVSLVERWRPLVDQVRSGFDPSSDATILVSSTVSADPTRLGVVAVSAPGVAGGVLSTASTNAARFVTLPDIAPTILGALDVPVPEEMTGQAITVMGGGDTGVSELAAARRAVVRDGERAVVRDAAFPFVVGTWAAVALAILLGCFGVTRLRLRREPIELLCLWSMSVPLVSFVVSPMDWQSWGAVGLWAATVFGSLAIGAGVWSATRRRPWIGVVTVMSITWLVLAAFGNVIQMSAVFGYSPIDGGRFAGFGNQAFLMLGWSALVTCAVGRLGGVPPPVPRGGRVAMVAVLLASIVVDGFIGADVGGLLSLIPTAVVAWFVFTGRRPPWRVLIGSAAVAASAVVVAALVDLSRPASERTHLGRLADRLVHGNGRDLLERKVLTMGSTFVQLWAPVMLIAVGFFIWRLVRPSPRSRAIEVADPTLRPFGIVASTFVVLATLTNDSGLRMTAALVGLAVAHVCWSTLTQGGHCDQAGRAGQAGQAGQAGRRGHPGEALR